MAPSESPAPGRSEAEKPGASGSEPSAGAAAAAAPGWGRAILVAGLAAALLLGAYIAHELLGGFIFPVGPDGPVYTWWTRYADALGLAGVAPGRPGVPAAALVLGTALGTTAVQTVMLLGPVLATAAGLAGAAVVESALGPDPRRALVAAVVTGTFAAYLAGGWLANMAQAALFIGGLATLASAERSWRAAWVGGAMLLASALAHVPFAVVSMIILIGAMLPSVPTAIRAARSGVRVGTLPVVRVASATLGIPVGIGLSALTLAGGIPGDTSQDGFFRRAGLARLLRDRYGERLWGDLRRMLLPLVAGVGLAAGLAVGSGPSGGAPGRPSTPGRGAGSETAPASISHATEQEGSRFLRRVLVAWAVLTVAGVVTLALILLGPPNRLLVFAFVIPLAAAAGAGVLLGARRPAWTAAAVVGVLVFGAASMFGWYRQYPSFAPEELAAAGRLGDALSGQPPGTHVVVIVDTTEPAAAFHVTRAANVIRMGLPPALIPTTRFVVGRPSDVLTRRPTLTGDPEHDLLARTYLREAMPVLDESLLVALEAFNAEGFAEAGRAGTMVAPGIAVVRAPAGAGSGTLHVPPPVDGYSLGLSPAGVVLLTSAALALLALLGAGWSRWGLPGASPLAAASLAPSAGLAVTVVAGFATDRIVPGAASPWGLAVALGLGAAGYVAALRARRRPR